MGISDDIGLAPPRYSSQILKNLTQTMIGGMSAAASRIQVIFSDIFSPASGWHAITPTHVFEDSYDAMRLVRQTGKMNDVRRLNRISFSASAMK
ncbi:MULTISPECIES: hypothetical protein [Marinobacter]|uniref:hypothetical protein n=1 Tax=Marinobacter TaxID=2742 RepID=UPI000718B640|nr:MULTISPECIES: hypothetical protein [Marinobacter]AMQ88722.1 hypothetical protein ASQ50_08425 [Marinobacter sp. LQ44]MCD1628803.1 hypothetical protein [Marinobacter shengliensis]